MKPKNPFVIIPWEDFNAKCEYRFRKNSTEYICGHEGITENPFPELCDYESCPYVSGAIEKIEEMFSDKTKYII